MFREIASRVNDEADSFCTYGVSKTGEQWVKKDND